MAGESKKLDTRELCHRIERSLGDRQSVQQVSFPTPKSPVLCVQLRSSPVAKSPGWVPRRFSELDNSLPGSPPVDAGAAQGRYLETSRSPADITESHIELLDLVAGESRSRTVQRVLRSRARLLASVSEGGHPENCCTKAEEGLCQEPARPTTLKTQTSQERSKSPDKRPSSCAGAQSSWQSLPESVRFSTGNFQGLVANTPRLLQDVESEPKQAALERLLASRSVATVPCLSTDAREGSCASAALSVESSKGKEGERDKDGGTRKEGDQVWQSVPSFARGKVKNWSSMASVDTTLAQRARESSEGATRPDHTDTWMSTVGKTLGLQLDGDIRYIMTEAFERPKGVVSRGIKGRSLRTHGSWRG
jgi:hypothetical protein